jgi:hypothetical protein
MKKNKYLLKTKFLLLFVVGLFLVVISAKNVSAAATCDITVTKSGTNMIINAKVTEAGIDCSNKVFFAFYLGHNTSGSFDDNSLYKDVSPNSSQTTSSSCSASQSATFSEIENKLGTDNEFNFKIKAYTQSGKATADAYFICEESTPIGGYTKNDISNTTSSSTTTNGSGSGSGNGSGSGSSGTISFTNPLQYSSVDEILTSFLNNLQGIIVTLSIIFIVIGGLFYITSAGDEKRITTAKGALTAALIGLAIGIAAPSFLKEISTALGWNSAPSSITSALSLTEILLKILNFLLSIAGVISLIMMIVGGVTYTISAGDEDMIKRAKKIFLFSVIGIALTLAAMVIVRQIAKFFA